MRVIGTAGHVDHGKSSLVRRLTGIDPDRLAEEKAREMTIDLGFAWFELPDGETVGVVDVPGHRDFIENMLAGIGGIDAAVLVIAADEGVMPQTREHLAILDLLGIEHGLIVLTKIDLIVDGEWLDLIEQEIHEFVQKTVLATAPIIRISSHTGAGIDLLLESLGAILADLPPRADYNHPRLPIDRVFTMSGFGTVVTGTLSGGTLHLGDDIEIQPTGRYGRIRGLQSYKQTVQTALPGSRTAVNISGIDHNEIERGHVLTYPGQIHPALLVDVHFRHLPDTGHALKHNAEVKFFSGAVEAPAHVRLLSDDMLMPGANGWLQIALDKPVALARGDRFILRYPSPSQTIGGGVIVNPYPAKRWRRFRQEVIHDLETRIQGTPAERIAQAAAGDEPLKRLQLQKLTGYGEYDLHHAVEEAIRENLLIIFSDNTYLSTASYHRLLGRIHTELAHYHQSEPLRLGMAREEIRSRLAIKNTTLNLILENQTNIIAEGNILRFLTHEIRFNDKQQENIEVLMRKMTEQTYSPLSFTEAAMITGERVLYALIELGEIVQVQTDVIFPRLIYEEMVAGALELIDKDGSVSAKKLRDRFNTSRKYAIGLLEHLDSLGITRRVGDERVRGKKS